MHKKNTLNSKNHKTNLSIPQQKRALDILNKNIYILLIISVLILAILGILFFKINNSSVISIEGKSSEILGTGNITDQQNPNDINSDTFDALLSSKVDSSKTKLTKTKSIISSQNQDRQDTQTLNVSYKFNEPTFVSEGSYSQVIMDDLENIAEQEGYPLIPVKQASILLPIGYSLTGIDVVSKNLVSLSGVHNLSFATQDVPLLSKDDLASMGFEVKDVVASQEIYSKSSFYPEKVYSKYSTSIQRGYTFLNLNLYPLRYNPVTGEVNYYSEIEITINLENTNQAPYTFRGTEYDKQVIENKRLASLFDSKDYQGDISTAIKEITPQEDEIKLDVLSSYEDIILDVPFNDPEGGYNPDGDAGSDGGAYAPFDGGIRDSCEYLIITTQDFASAFQVLADYKSTRAQDPLSSCVFTVQEIYDSSDYSCTGYWNLEDGCGSQNQFNDNSARIRNFIRYAYDQLQTKYVLLGGDADYQLAGGETQEVIVPVRYLFPTGASYARDIASDIYFSNLDGSFDVDEDTVFGEDATELDLESEVYVGRVPADSVLEVNNFVEKVIFNELNPVNPKPLIVGEYLGFGGVSDYATGSMEQIRLGSSDDGYSTIGFFPTFDPSQLPVLYDSPEYTWEYLDLLNLMNNDLTIINHLGHANNLSAMRLNNTIVESLLINVNPIFIYTQGCYPGGFDNLNSNMVIISNDSLAEHLLFLPSPRGSVAVMMNNRYGWGSRNSLDGPSQWFARWFWDGQFNPLVLDKSVSAINSYSHEQNNYRIENGSGIAKFVYYETNILGDPELKLNVSNQYSQNMIIQLINNSETTSFNIDANVSNLDINNTYNYRLDIGYFEDYGVVWIPEFVFTGNFIATDTNHLINLDSINYMDLLASGFAEGAYIFKVTIDDGIDSSVASTMVSYKTKQISTLPGIILSGDERSVAGSLFVGENYYFTTSIPSNSMAEIYFEGDNRWFLGQFGATKDTVYKLDSGFNLIYSKKINVNASWANLDFFYDGSNWWVLDGISKSVYKYDSDFNYLGINFSLSAQVTNPVAIFKQNDFWYVLESVLNQSNSKVYKYNLNWEYSQNNFDLGYDIEDIFWDGSSWFGLKNRKVYNYTSDWVSIKTYTIPTTVYAMPKSIFWDGTNWWATTSYNSDIFKLNVDFNIINLIPFIVEYKNQTTNSDWDNENILQIKSVAPILTPTALFKFNSNNLDEGKYIFRFVYNVNGNLTYDDVADFYISVKSIDLTDPLPNGLYSSNSDLLVYGSLYPLEYSTINLLYKESSSSTWINSGLISEYINYERQSNILIGSFQSSLFNPLKKYDLLVRLINDSGNVYEKTILNIGFDSKLKPNYPINLANLVDSSFYNGSLLADRIPFLVNSDLDNDGNSELVVIVKNVLFAYKINGTIMPGFPITLGSQLSKFAIGNIDSDPEQEIIVINDIQRATGADAFLIAYNFNGSIVSGFPITKNQFNYYLNDQYIWLQNSSLVLNDIDNDGINEIIFGANSTDNLDYSRVFAYEGNGTLKWTFVFEDKLSVWTNTMISSGDVDCDGLDEIVAAGNSSYAYVLSGSGTLESKFTLPYTYNLIGYLMPSTIEPKLVNIDSDCKKEIFFGSKGGGYDGLFSVFAYDINGSIDWYKGFLYVTNYANLQIGVPNYIYDFSVQQLPSDMNYFNIVFYKNFYSTAPTVSDINLSIVNSNTSLIYIPVSGGQIPDLKSLIQINIHGANDFARGDSTPLLIDLTGDGISEYVMNIGITRWNLNYGTTKKIYAFDMQGNTISEFPISFPNFTNWPYSNPTVIDDLDSDGLLEVSVISPWPDYMIYTWDLNIPKYNIEWGNYQQNPAMTGLAKDMSFGPMVATPVAAPAAGSYTSAQSVTLSTTTSDANIYYTLDGSEPTQVSTRYTSAITISTTTTLKAKAYKNGMTASNTLIATYTIGTTAQVATPVTSPAAGNYTSAQNVTLSTTTSGASIYYTTNGTTPTTSSTLYSSAISISSTTTLKAIAVKSGMNNSALMTSLYTITIPGTVATPVTSPAAGNYTSAQNITLSTTTSGASIYYTTNGTTPTTSSTLYTSAISISSTTTIKAIAVKSGMNNSSVMTALYTITIPGTVATPVASPAAGNYTSTQSVTLSTTTSGASIYYTRNGTTPTTSSTLYSSAISISSTTTIKAIAVKSGMNNSSVMTALYTITIPGTVATPVASPAAGNYTSTQSVTLSTTTSGASIYYTRNGTTPTTSSTLYSSAISISSTTTIKAIAVKSGMNNSAVMTALYTITIPGTVATPVAAPAAGSYTSAQNITLSTTTSGASIYYTTNGTTPTTSSTLYSSAISISTTTTLKAIAVKSGMNNSAVMTALYTITIPGTVATPVASPAAGSYTSAQNVTLSTTTSGASIYYTTNGTTPTTSSTLYTSAISISSTTTIKAIAVKSGMNNSAVMTALYTITIPGTVATPVASPAAGNYASAQSVTLSTTTSGASIYYTTNGTTPTTSSTLYSSAISISTTTTIKAIAVKSGMNNSAVMTALYTITIPGTVATPVASPAAGSYTSTQSVTLSTTTSGASIYYTINGTTPTTSSTLYTSAISISSTTTIKAIAVKSGMNNSALMTSLYTITIPGTVATPVANPAAGNYASAQSVTLSTTTSDANIYYTLDGTQPTQVSTLYTSSISISTTTTLKAKAYKTGMNASNTLVADYNIYQSQVVTPVAAPAAGTYTSAQTISFSFVSQDTNIYYTLDGSEPTDSSTRYTSTIVISTTTTLKAKAYRPGYLPSNTFTSTYAINIDDGGSGDNGGDSGGSSGGGSGGSSNPVSTVVIDLIGGTYTSSQTISLSTTTSGASIYYTLDGTTPSTSSSLYTSPIIIDSTCTLKAIAVKSGYLPSSLASEVYTINNPTIIDLINPTPSHSSGSRVSKVNETEDSVSYQVTSITSESSDIPINLLGVSLSNLKIFSKEITDANVSVIKDITQEDYNLLYIDKIYSVFNLNISNQEKITYVSYDFIVDRSWLTENKVGARDMVAYTISNDRESVLKIKYLGDSQQGSTYNLTVAPIDGKIIIGSQTQEYKDILKSKKTVGYIVLAAIILVLIFIILLIIRIMKHKTEGLEEKPKEIFDVIKNTPPIENKEQTKNQDKKIEIK